MQQTLNINRIKAAMVEKGMTQREFAYALDISTVYLSKLLNSKSKMNVDLLAKIAKVTDKELSYFFIDNTVNKSLT